MSPSTPQDWEIESDMRTLSEAEKIKADAGRMSRVRSFAARKAAEMSKIAGQGDNGAADMVAKGYRKVK